MNLAEETNASMRWAREAMRTGRRRFRWRERNRGLGFALAVACLLMVAALGWQASAIVGWEESLAALLAGGGL